MVYDSLLVRPQRGWDALELLRRGLPLRPLPDEVPLASAMVDPGVKDADQRRVHTQVEAKKEEEAARHHALKGEFKIQNSNDIFSIKKIGKKCTIHKKNSKRRTHDLAGQLCAAVVVQLVLVQQHLVVEQDPLLLPEAGVVDAVGGGLNGGAGYGGLEQQSRGEVEQHLASDILELIPQNINSREWENEGRC